MRINNLRPLRFHTTKRDDLSDPPDLMDRKPGKKAFTSVNAGAVRQIG